MNKSECSVGERWTLSTKLDRWLYVSILNQKGESYEKIGVAYNYDNADGVSIRIVHE